MNGVFVDSCVLLDLFTADPQWADWSEAVLERYSQTNSLYINSMVYAEVSVGFERIEAVEQAIALMDIKVIEIPREALFLAGKVFLQYRKNKGAKRSPLPDFFIGAHVLVSEFALITRDLQNYKTYFPQATLICPDTEV
ncbi:type II toxin-antitoxin system VapC family toxin [cf. Phormidesmis sp. LEGE 11477]|uniref:type II toxin-antitoxin system VapC family toxin n=1 Tax=cf. Phormidesmis sp. LEGE 11477 TaxID=1828680 RepID=UPI0018820F27|nr:PIN domain-containing protein [cf. Phormidesmis sp. LEGE 11477]MBE9063782.1 PIN domain-containing protein [cf. Phormidesmis sp. LEGE 11477]